MSFWNKSIVFTGTSSEEVYEVWYKHGIRAKFDGNGDLFALFTGKNSSGFDLRLTSDLLGTPSTEVVAGVGGNAGTYHDMYIDSSNNIHVVYYDLDNNRCLYNVKIYSTGLWGTEQEIDIIDGTYDDEVGKHLSIYVDSSGDVHVIYRVATIGDDVDLAYNIRDNGTGLWTTRTIIDNVPEVGNFTSLMVDTSGQLHAVYAAYDSDGAGLNAIRYNYTVAGVWQTAATITNTSVTVDPFQAIIDSNDIIHVAYERSGDVYYINNSSGWISPVLLTTVGSDNNRISMGTDPYDNVHVLYINSDDSTYADQLMMTSLEQATDTWSEDSIVNSPSYGNDLTMVIPAVVVSDSAGIYVIGAGVEDSYTDLQIFTSLFGGDIDSIPMTVTSDMEFDFAGSVSIPMSVSSEMSYPGFGLISIPMSSSGEFGSSSEILIPFSAYGEGAKSNLGTASIEILMTVDAKFSVNSSGGISLGIFSSGSMYENLIMTGNISILIDVEGKELPSSSTFTDTILNYTGENYG